MRSHFHRLIFASVAGIGLWLGGGTSFAFDITPFDTFNQSPLIQIYGLPSIDDARLVARNQTTLRFSLDLASNFTSGSNAVEDLELDGETYRTTLTFRRGISDRIEVGVDIPYVAHNSGFLDGFIVDWHDAFGLSQGGRDRAPQDLLNYRYSRNGTDLFNVTRNTSGLGDIRLTGAYQLSQTQRFPKRAVALRTSVKLPTGDSDRLLGSGGTDIAVWVTLTEQRRVGKHHWGWFGGGGVMLLGNGDILPDQQRDHVLFGSIGIGWRPWPRIAFKLQMDAHSRFYDNSKLKQLNTDAAQLIMGGTISLSDKSALELAVSEDIVVNTAPDVNFHINLRSRF